MTHERYLKQKDKTLIILRKQASIVKAVDRKALVEKIPRNGDGSEA